MQRNKPEPFIGRCNWHSSLVLVILFSLVLIGACQNTESSDAVAMGLNESSTGQEAKVLSVESSQSSASLQGFVHLAADSKETKGLLEPLIAQHLSHGREALKKEDLTGALNAYQTAGNYQSEQGASTLAQHRIIAFILADDPTLLSRDSLDQAASVLSGLLAVDPNYSHVYRAAQANLMVLQGNMKSAIQTLTDVLAEKPDYLPAREGLGVALANNNRPEEAIKALKQVLESKPNSVRAHTVIAALLARTGRVDDAIHHSRKSLELAPKATTHLFLGELLQKKGTIDQAIEQYRRAVLMNKKNPVGFARLGSILLQKGGTDKEARDSLNRAFELQPNGDVLYQLAIAEARLGAHDKALQYLSRLAKDSPNVHTVFQTIAEIEELRGNAKAALSAYLHAYQLLKSVDNAKPENLRLLVERIQKLQKKAPAVRPEP